MISMKDYSDMYRQGVITYLRSKRLLRTADEIYCEKCSKPLKEEYRYTSVDGLCFRCSTCGKRYSHRTCSIFRHSKKNTDILVDIMFYGFLMRISQQKVCIKHNMDSETVRKIYNYCRVVIKDYLENYIYKMYEFGTVSVKEEITPSSTYDYQYKKLSNFSIENGILYVISPACEVDEVELGKHTIIGIEDKKRKKKKIAISALGIYDRGYKFTKMFFLHDKKKETLFDLINDNVKTLGSNQTRIYTDSNIAYDNLKWFYEHHKINKQELRSKGGKGIDTTNHIESYFSELKATKVFNNAFLSENPKEWELYLKEAEFRVFCKKKDLFEEFVKVLQRTDMIIPSCENKEIEKN